MSEAYALCDRCGRMVPAEGDRDGEGFELCDACIEALAEGPGPAEVPAPPVRRPRGRPRRHRRAGMVPETALAGPWRGG